MQQQGITPTTNTITRDLEELDRLVHRIKTQLQSSSKDMGRLSHWRAMRGILKGKITEDPLAYQRRIRADSERS
ncbi:MAG: hypothetical protein Q7S48_00975 [bacterium]|nr:hypothetical protein [bacterium]